MPKKHGFKAGFAALAFLFSLLPAMAELDGHGPDAWRVTGVRADDALNARMGPGTSYRVIETFAHDERGMILVTCVPYMTLAHYSALTQAEIDALPARWCLMRNAGLSKAGWVAQRFITPDNAVPAEAGDDMVDSARGLVQRLFDANARAEQGIGPDPLRPPLSDDYFTDDITAALLQGLGAHPLYGAQDFSGQITRIAPDADQPMFRGMIMINVDFTNFNQPQRAVFYLRADPGRPGAPPRIFRVEHDGWAYP